MHIFELDIIHVGLGLILLIVANIILGSIDAVLKHCWDAAKFRAGCIKGTLVTISLAAVWFAGWLNPNLLVIEADGQQVNLATAVYLLLLAAFSVYAVDIVGKLRKILTTVVPESGNAAAQESDEEEVFYVPETTDATVRSDEELPVPSDCDADNNSGSYSI